MRALAIASVLLLGAPTLATPLDFAPGWTAPPLLRANAEDVEKTEAALFPGAGLPSLGAMLDAGVPDGLGASAVYRPLYWLRLHLGVSTTTFSSGVRGGVTLVPLNFWISPSLTLEGGFLSEGDANGLVRTFSGNPQFSSTLLEKVSYAYGNAHLGVELGPPRRFHLSRLC